MSEFIITKKTYTYSTCVECKGTGEKHTFFRKMDYVVPCPICEGGRIRHTQAEEFPLIEALKELSVLI